MKLDALDHPKTLDFAARLDVSRPTAIGHLELLWAFTGKQSAQGNIGKWPDGAIARACDWMGPPEAFINALVDSGFLDRDPGFRLTVHDWSHHAPSWVRAKLKKVGLEFVEISASSEPSSESTREPTIESSSDPPSETSEASLEPSILAKRSEAKGRTLRERADSPPVPGLDPEAWARWLDYRTKIRKPLKPVSFPAAQRELAAYGGDQAAVVEQSVAQGWQGLFALKSPAKPVARPERQGSGLPILNP